MTSRVWDVFYEVIVSVKHILTDWLTSNPKKKYIIGNKINPSMYTTIWYYRNCEKE